MENKLLPLQMDSIYRVYDENQDPVKDFDKVKQYSTEIARLTSQFGGSSITEKNIHKEMTSVVFGSNTIERVGLGRDDTVEICQRVFRGDRVEIGHSEDRYRLHIITWLF